MSLTIAGFKARAKAGGGFFTPLSGIQGIENATVSQVMGLDDAILEIEHAVEAGSNPAKFMGKRGDALKALRDSLDEKVAKTYKSFIDQGLSATDAQALTVEKVRSEAKIGIAAINKRYPDSFGGSNVLKSIFARGDGGGEVKAN